MRRLGERSSSMAEGLGTSMRTVTLQVRAAQVAAATRIHLPDDSADARCHRPAILRCRSLRRPFRLFLRLAAAQCSADVHPDLFNELTDTEGRRMHRSIEPQVSVDKTIALFTKHNDAKALSEGRRVVAPEGIGVVVFAHKTTRRLGSHACKR